MTFRTLLFTVTLAAVAGCSGARGLAPLTPAQPAGIAGPKAVQRPAPLPSSCTNYKRFSGAGLPITFIDNSGLSASYKNVPPLYLYVYSGSLGKYLSAKDGTLQSLPTGSDPATYEYPLACFTGTGAPKFVLPALASSNSFRVYVSFGQLTIPAGGTPSDEPAGVPANYKNPNAGILWDYFEYTYPNIGNSGLSIDTTQVDSFAMPFTLTVTAAGQATTVGTKSYARIVSAFKAESPWNSLVVEGSVGDAKLPLRIMSPDDATTRVCTPACQPYLKGFPTDYFTSPAYYKPSGYLSALLHYYATAGDKTSATYHKIVSVAYGLNGCNSYYDYGAGALVCPTYFASSDGKSNFVFTLRNDAGVANLPQRVSLPVGDFGYVDAIDGIWGIPFAPGSSLADRMQFYMYKALATDLNRGVAMQTSWHGVAPCTSPSKPPSGCLTYDTAPIVPAGANYYRSVNLTNGLPAIFNGYAAILHDNFIGGLVYAQSYDDYWSQSTEIGTSRPPTSIAVTIESMRL